MGAFIAEIRNEAHEAQAALNRNLKGLMTPGVVCPKDQILCFFFFFFVPRKVRSHPQKSLGFFWLLSVLRLVTQHL